MNSEQIASLTAMQSNIENGNQGSGARNGNGRAPNSGDGCCINGVGSKTRELLDRVPPCTGNKTHELKIEEEIYVHPLYHISTCKIIFINYNLDEKWWLINWSYVLPQIKLYHITFVWAFEYRKFLENFLKVK